MQLDVERPDKITRVACNHDKVIFESVVPGPTPGGSEVEQHRIAFKRFDAELFAVEVLGL